MSDTLPDRRGTRSERFAHGSFVVDLLVPESAESLIDDAEFERDERLPYWAEIWPAARSLTRYLLDAPMIPGRVIELGSGIALPSLALRRRGAEVLATDYYAEALEFAHVNARRNGIPQLETLLLDWRVPPPGLPRFRRAIAADVAYERRNSEALAVLLPLLIEPGGDVLIADPGRAFLEDLCAPLERSGWRATPVATYTEQSPAGPATPSVTVRIVSLRCPTTPTRSASETPLQSHRG